MSNQNLGNRWRKKSKRGVSPIIATILLVAITVVLAAVLYILISGLTKGPGNTPLGTALTLGTPVAGGSGAATTYTMAITPSSGLTSANLAFQVVSSSNIIQSPPAGANITVKGVTGCLLAIYTFATNAWATPAGASACASAGPNVVLQSGEQFVLAWGSSLSSAGNKLVVVGQGTFSSTISVSIP
jgi:flagellin-like protein